MSAICAVVRRDGHTLGPTALDALLAAAPHRGRFCDRRSDISSIVGCQNLAPSRQRSGVDRLGPLTVAFHGRIDNRAELLKDLVPRWPEAAGDDNARLVLRAFVHWHDECAARLLGDFAFVIRDSSRGLTYAARDPMGVKPLYYLASPRQLVLATELTQVLASGVDLAPFEPMVAELLAFDVRSRSETLYRGVHRLPPGHWMIATDRDVRVAEYWAPDRESERCYSRDDDYADECFQLLEAAVADRADADEPAAAYLSGGLDSSSVVCMAGALGRPLETFSLEFPDIPEADEREYIDAVAGHVRVPSHRLRVVPIEADGYRRRAALRADLPELPSDALGESLLAAMHDRGLHVALTGVGGDFGFAGSLLHYADLLQARDFIGLARQWRADRRTPDVGWSSGQLFSQGVRLMLPDAARRAARPLARRLGFGITVPPWLDPAFAARTNLLDRLGAPRSRATSAPPSRQHVCELFESGWTSRLLESSDRAAAEHGIELRHPFYDRRLVEFAIAIPESQRWRGRTTKFVMRHAMRRLLPESVYARMGKADASAFVPHAVDVLGGESALHRLHLARLGWVRADVLVETYRRAIGLFEEGDDRYCSAMFNVWMALAVDAWYRATFVEDSSHERLTERRRPDQGGGNTSGSDGWQPAPEALSVARAR